jgi:SAM-dependent methyltransferase
VYTENSVNDTILFLKALLSNQLARFAPSLYVKLTKQTGRGFEEETSRQVADYFIYCFQQYREQIGLASDEFSQYLSEKSVLEYGPGDTLGVALLMYAYGAKRVDCVDRFALSSLSESNIEVYTYILNSLDPIRRKRANDAFREKGCPESGWNPSAVTYSVTRNGCAGGGREYDLIISRAVLEHVNDLEETIIDIKRSLKPGGISIHQVDLKSHGLDRYTPFDFLTWPTLIYGLMYSRKGFPNRWRVDKYKELAVQSGLSMKKLIPIDRLDTEKVNLIYGKLARELKGVSREDLSWKSFWMVLEHAP